MAVCLRPWLALKGAAAYFLLLMLLLPFCTASSKGLRILLSFGQKASELVSQPVQLLSVFCHFKFVAERTTYL